MTPKEAVALQREMRDAVILQDDFGSLKTVAGLDVSYDKGANTTHAFAVLMDLDSLDIVATARAVMPTTFPYVPGLLSFREIPAILEALARLPAQPDFLMMDGQGIAHPRRIGVAAHLGLVTNIPTIGVAKSRLIGTHDEPGHRKGAYALLYDKEERIGTVLRSRDDVRPLYISPGHRVGQDSAVALTLRCLTRYRLPEPTRLADRLSKAGK